MIYNPLNSMNEISSRIYKYLNEFGDEALQRAIGEGK
jgi:hypothetical protein